MSYNQKRGFDFPKFKIKGSGGRTGAAIPPPPPRSQMSKQGYHTMHFIAQNALQTSTETQKRTNRTEEEYFDDDEDVSKDPMSSTSSQLAYIPAPGSPSNQLIDKKGNGSNRGKQGDSDSEEDPLDAFMAGIDAELKHSKPKVAEDLKDKGFRNDIDGEDDEESYYRYMEENPTAGLPQEDSDQEVEYDSDGNPVFFKSKKDIDPLPPVDHSLITYEPFEKNFYLEHDDIANLTKASVEELRQHLNIKVSGPAPPHPVSSFGHYQFDEALIKAIRKSEYTQPTPIQAQAVPVALNGRDLIGVAKTGSGKTAAFIWPMLVHIMDQRELKEGEGPIGLILVPTRELCQQIYVETKKFGKVYNLRVCCCYGGGSKWEQSKALEQGAEIVVATPGRMIDLVKCKATNLTRVTFLVLDEADRMFDMGFEPQVRSICNHVRPDKQILLFSATFKKKIEKLARDVLVDPVKIVQGDIGEANADITQRVMVFNLANNPSAKWTWLQQNLIDFLSSGSLLIFVTKKLNAEELANSLKLKEHEVLLLHGDIDQVERNKVITQFKKKEVSILVATDVAARGLDIPHIRTVVNYDIARDIDTHTHRIGRTGRAGEKGTAWTLVSERDKEFVGHLVRNLESANQEVPEELMSLALQSSWFRKSRFKGGKGKRSANVGGAGLGFRAGKPNKPSGESISYNFSAPGASSGPGTDRLSAMKAAFRSQYNSQFRASTDHTWEKTITPPSVVMPPPPPPSTKPEQEGETTEKKRKKSRWE